jgi:hypothetical protein
VIELDSKGHAGKIFGGEFQSGLRQVDAVIMIRVGARERRAHLARIAARDIDKGERLRNRGESLMQDRADLLVRKRVGVDQFLIRRPLFLKLLERGLVGDGAPGLQTMDVNVHCPKASALLRHLAVSSLHKSYRVPGPSGLALANRWHLRR